MDLPKRKPTRLKGYDYSTPGMYFRTVCVKDREKLLGEIVWQSSCNDHIIRGERDYKKIWEYIDTNILRWEKDCFYNN